jgi:penicillin-binding protein 2
LLKPDEVFNCNGAYVFSDNTQIKCLREHGMITFGEAISKSCNTTFVQLGLRLGNNKLVEYAEKLGFVIGINNASVPALLGNASIGQQGVLVSPLQIANLYATIARNGAYQPCRIVSEIRNYQGDVIQEYPGKPALQVVSANTCQILTQALVAAVQPCW